MTIFDWVLDQPGLTQFAGLFTLSLPAVFRSLLAITMCCAVMVGVINNFRR